MKSLRTLILPIAAVFALAIPSLLHAQVTKKTEAACKKMVNPLPAAAVLNNDLIDFNFRVDDLIFVNGTATGNAYNKAKNQYGQGFFTGLQVDYKCSGSVVVFVDPKGRSQDQLIDIYNKIIGFVAVGLTKAEIRPLDRQVETDGEAHF